MAKAPRPARRVTCTAEEDSRQDRFPETTPAWEKTRKGRGGAEGREQESERSYRARKCEEFFLIAEKLHESPFC